MMKINFSETIKSKFILYLDWLYYFFPLAFSILFFFKIGDISYWFDELVTVNTINPDTTQNFFNNYFKNELHPPLYFVSLKIFVKIVTLLTESAKILWLVAYNYYYSMPVLNFLVDDIINIYQQYFAFYFPNKINNLSELSVRLISALSMTGVNIVIFNFFKKKNYVLIGLLACLFIGLNDKMIHFAQDARPYALLSLLFVMVAAEFYSTYKKPVILENFKKLIFLNTLLIMTHYYGVFVVLAEILIFTVINFKNKKLLFCAIVFFVSYFTAVNFLGEIFNLSRLTHLQKDSLSVLPSIYKAVFGVFSIRVLIICLGLVVLKFLIKKNSGVDKVLIKASVFLLTIVIIIQVTNMVTVILYDRYLYFLIPLFTVIYTILMYSAAETLTFWFKQKYFKWTAFLALYLFAGCRLAHVAYANTFYFSNYYENGKYYPIKSAYQKISQDVDFTPNSSYILEEHIPEYFQYYEVLYQLKPILNLSPSLAIESINQQLKSLAATNNEKVIYYIRSQKPYINNQRSEGPLVFPGYSKHILYNKNTIILFKFIKEN